VLPAIAAAFFHRGDYMRWYREAVVVALAGVGACAGERSAPLTTLADSASYAVGMNMGAQLRQVKDEIQMDALVEGLRDMVQGDTTRLAEPDAMRVLQTFASQVRERQAEGRTAVADSNTQAGDTYRAENAKRTGVQTTASGLQYEVLTAGSGPKPAASDRVRVHYRGTLIDGKEFDSSYRVGEPVTFEVGGVIPGWTEGLQLMPVGSKYRLVIPPGLGYGPQGAPPDIGPNATLIFEVELLEIQR
jgi:FKBP-type peptidyl-prolyl cis-trans isomerase FkpA